MSKRKNYSGPERRRHLRVPIAARVRIPGNDQVDYVFARDISEGGIGLDLDNSLKVGQVVEMEISISGVDKLIKVKGKVVRKISNGEKGVGLMFTRFAPYSKARLKKAMDILEKD